MVPRWQTRNVWAFAFCLVGTVLAASRRPETKLSPSYHGLWTCPGRNAYAVLNNYTITKDAIGRDSLNADFTLPKRVKGVSKLTITLHRHAEGEAWEYFATWKWTTALCDLLLTTNGLWCQLIQNVSPALKCPVERGHYRLSNGTIDFGALERLIPSSEKYTWRVEANVLDDLGDLGFCTIVELHMSRVLVKRRG